MKHPISIKWQTVCEHTVGLTHQNGLDLLKAQKPSTHYIHSAKLSKALVSMPHVLLLRPVLGEKSDCWFVRGPCNQFAFSHTSLQATDWLMEGLLLIIHPGVELTDWPVAVTDMGMWTNTTQTISIACRHKIIQQNLPLYDCINVLKSESINHTP